LLKEPTGAFYVVILTYEAYPMRLKYLVYTAHIV